MRNEVKGGAYSREQLYLDAGIDPKGKEFLEELNLVYEGIRSTFRGGARFLTGVFNAPHSHRRPSGRGHHKPKIRYDHPPRGFS